jgi:glycosyltransferase involved in cell wall biosynthesis
VGGIPDIIEDGKTGYLVEKSLTNEQIGDRLLAIFENPGERKKLGEQFQTQVEARFSQKAWLSKLEEVYASLKS